MRRIILVIVFLLLSAIAVFGQENNVVITSPIPVSELSGTVEVVGTANPADMRSYFLEVAEYGVDPPIWLPVSLPSSSPVQDGLLSQWDTTLQVEGIYQLRLHVVLESGERLYYVVQPLRITNVAEPPPTAIPTPVPVTESSVTLQITGSDGEVFQSELSPAALRSVGDSINSFFRAAPGLQLIGHLSEQYLDGVADGIETLPTCLWTISNQAEAEACQAEWEQADDLAYEYAWESRDEWREVAIVGGGHEAAGKFTLEIVSAIVGHAPGVGLASAVIGTIYLAYELEVGVDSLVAATMANYTNVELNRANEMVSHYAASEETEQPLASDAPQAEQPADAGLSMISTPRPVGMPITVDVEFTGNPDACPALEAPMAVDVVLVMDVSGSMQGTRLAAAKSAAISFVQQLNPDSDNVGLVTFTGEASILSQLGGSFDTIIGMISGLEAEGGTAIHAGLTAGHNVLQGSGRFGTVPVVLLLSDGQSDPEEARAAAARIRSDNAQVLTVGVGEGTDQGLLASLASGPQDYLYSRSNQGLRELFTETAFRLTTGRILAHDVSIRVHVNSGYFSVAENLLTDGATVTPNDVVEWHIPAVYEGTTSRRSLVVEPMFSGDASVGTVEITYGECEDGDVVAVPFYQTPTITIVTAGEAAGTTPEDVLQVGTATTGTLDAFDAERWVIDVRETELFTVVVMGAGSDLPPEIYSGDAEAYYTPLYSIPIDESSAALPSAVSSLESNAQGLLLTGWHQNHQGATPPAAQANNRRGRLSVYRIDNPDLFWFYLQSNGQDDSGSYSVTIEEGFADDPPPIYAGGPSITYTAEEQGVQVYALQGAAAPDPVTITYQNEDNPYASVRAVSLDGELIEPLYAIRDSDSSEYVLVFALRGSGPYRLVVQGSGDYTLTTTPGDQLAIDRGALSIGQTRTSRLQADRFDRWNFEGQFGSGVTIIMRSQDREADPYLRLIGPEGAVIAYNDDYDDLNAQIGPLALPSNGSYTIVASDARNDNIEYELILDRFDLPSPVNEEIASGQVVQGTLFQGRDDNWLFDGRVGQTVMVSMRGVEDRLDPYLILTGPDGDEVAFNDDYIGRDAQIGPLVLQADGQYTITVSGQRSSGGDYELWFMLQDASTVDLEPRQWSLGQQVFIVNPQGAWLRQQPTSNSNVVTTDLIRGDSITIAGDPLFDGVQWWWPVHDNERGHRGWLEENSLDERLGAAWAVGQELIITNAQGAWLRQHPDSNADVVSTDLMSGDPVTITGDAVFDGQQWWWPIEDMRRSIRGWVEENSIGEGSPSAGAAFSGQTGATVQVIPAQSLNLRFGPGTGFDVVSNASRNDTLPAFGRNLDGTWLQVTLSDGQNAWVYTSLITVANAGDDINNLPVTAYGVGNCVRITADSSRRLGWDWCVNSVVVVPGQGIRVHTSRTAFTSSGYRLDIYSDVGNRNMYLTDNLGNRYDFTTLGGAASRTTNHRNGTTSYAWYLFPFPDSNATALTFHDDDQSVVISWNPR